MGRQNYHFNSDDYVHVTQHMGENIIGIYDGVKYVFVDGVPSEPVHWKVAHHVFGYMGTNQARMNALHRLGWLTRMDELTAMNMLKTRVEFQPMDPLPRGVVAFKKPTGEATEPDEAVTPTNGTAPAGTPEAGHSSQSPVDPFHASRGSRSKRTAE